MKPLDEIYDHDLEEIRRKVGEKVGEEVGEYLTNNQLRILYMLSNSPKSSAKKISNRIGISCRKVEENIAKLKEKQLLERIGSAKGGYWKVKV